MNQLNFRSVLRPLLVLSIVASAGTALATHKNWVLKTGGSECLFLSPGTADSSNGLLSNSSGTDKTAICPIVLANRWYIVAGGVHYGYKTWANSLGAAVYFNKATAASTISCYGAAVFSDHS